MTLDVTPTPEIETRLAAALAAEDYRAILAMLRTGDLAPFSTAMDEGKPEKLIEVLMLSYPVETDSTTEALWREVVTYCLTTWKAELFESPCELWVDSLALTTWPKLMVA